jgi:putative transcriptional regulator
MSKIADLRQAKNLTQMEVAIYLDVDPSTIRNWERGDGNFPMWIRMAKLCDLLECSPWDLIGEEYQ